MFCLPSPKWFTFLSMASERINIPYTVVHIFRCTNLIVTKFGRPLNQYPLFCVCRLTYLLRIKLCARIYVKWCTYHRRWKTVTVEKHRTFPTWLSHSTLNGGSNEFRQLICTLNGIDSANWNIRHLSPSCLVEAYPHLICQQVPSQTSLQKSLGVDVPRWRW